METRDRVAKILDDTFKENCCVKDCKNCNYIYNGEMCRHYLFADALIAAGVGFCDKNLNIKKSSLRPENYFDVGLYVR